MLSGRYKPDFRVFTYDPYTLHREQGRLFCGIRNRCKGYQSLALSCKRDKILEFLLAKSFNLVCQGQDKTICFCFSPTLPTAAGLYPLKRNYRMEQAAECSIPWASHGPQSLLYACQRRFKSRGDENPSPRWRQWEALGEGQETRRHRLTVETAARRFLLLSALTRPFFFFLIQK